MNNYQTATQAILEKLETDAKEAKNLAELEQLVIQYGQELSRTAFAELSKDVEERTFPPEESLP